ncbi:MAG TPA: hypothetical protein VN688_34115 [Gemmataceae bacterium]|nr:hypothetical protein [Gemmataceae bacterium]
MWTMLALMSALNATPAQAGQLELKNVRYTYGILGQERKETPYLPGDVVVIAFDIEGLKVAPNGQVQYSMSTELTGKEKDPGTNKPKVLFRKDPQNLVTVNTLGGSRLPSIAYTEIGVKTDPGEYTMTVVVTDVAAKATVKLERKFEVLRTQFGIVRPGFTYIDMNERGSGGTQIAPPVAVPGQSLQLNFALVGFELDKSEKQLAKLSVKMEILDETGKPVLEKPFTGVAQELDAEYKNLRVSPFRFPMQINRSGKFKIVLSAKDEITGKTATQTLDLKVIEVN